MHIKDHNDAMKFFRTYDNVASKGKWKEFVDEMEFDSMAQEPRTMAQGGRIGLQDGQLVRNTADGSRPGYSGVPGQGMKKLTITDKKRIANYEKITGKKYENQKTNKRYEIREDVWTGKGRGKGQDLKARRIGTDLGKIENYLLQSIKENKGKPVTFKTVAEIKKNAGVTSNIDAGITRLLKTDKFKNKIIRRKFEMLPDETIKEIKAKYSNIVPKDKWDFKKYRFGINKTDFGLKVYARITESVKEPKPFRYLFDISTPEGWMLAQMDRAYAQGSKLYEPIYRTINDVKKIAGYIDNTEKGGGKKWFASDKFIKGKDVDGVLIKGGDKYKAHPDLAENVKFHDMVKKAGQKPNKAIIDILKTGGIDEKGLKLKHVLNYMLDNADYGVTRNSIVRHHKGQLKNATSDLQILDRVKNIKVTGIEERIAAGTILPKDVAKLKRFGVSVRGPDGTLYGSGAQTAKGGMSTINRLILEGSTNKELYEKEIKGIERWKKADFDKFKNYLEKLGCPKGGKASGGRAGFSTGTTCATKGREVATRILRNGTATDAQKTILKQMVGAGSAFLKGTAKFAGNILNPKEFFKLRNWVGPEAAAFMAGIEGGIIGYDVINNNTPIKEALGANWATSWAMPKTMDEYQIEEMREKGGFSNESSERFAKSQELASELNRDYEEIEFLKIDPTKSEEVARKQKAYDAKEAEYFSFVGEGKGMDPYEFEKDRGRMLEERGAGSYDPENLDANEYGYVDVADETLLKKKLFGIGLPESWVDQSSGPLPLKKSTVPIYDLPPSEIAKMPEVPFEQGADWALDMKAKLKDVHEIKTPGDYRFAEYEKLTEQDKIDLTNYYRAMGKLKENQKVEDLFWDDTGTSILEEAAIAKKWSQLYNYPGMQGSQDPYADGGLAGLMKKKW